MITTYLVLTCGIVVLIWIAVLIGTSMDTESQRREGRRIARERRLLREERQAAAPPRPLYPDGLCADCPLRR